MKKRNTVKTECGGEKNDDFYYQVVKPVAIIKVLVNE